MSDDEAPKQQARAGLRAPFASALAGSLMQRNLITLHGPMSGDLCPSLFQAAAAEEGLEDVEDTQDERAEKKRRNERQRTGPPLHVELPVPAAKSAQRFFCFSCPQPRRVFCAVELIPVRA